MIISESKAKSETEGMGETVGFSMNLDGMMFDNLINGIYADKIAAPIRELSTNARDGHARRGNLDTPFDIKLPTRLDQEFSVRDYGSSLTHDEIMHMYTVLGTSTKRNTNDETGCLGLGSKSPFAYTSAFTVTCWLDGEERTYSAYITTSGIPNMSLVFQEKSDEPQGVKVAFAVKDGDIEKFNKSAATVLLGFDPEPNISPKSFKLASREISLEGEGWKITTESVNSVIVQGSVSYPIDINNVELSAALKKEWPSLRSYYSRRSFGEQVLSNSTIINVDIGSVDVVTSRESLQYTSKTITSIINKLKDIQTEMKSKIESLIKDSKGYREACEKFNKLKSKNNAVSRVMNMDTINFSESEFKFRGKTLSNIVPLYKHDVMIMERGWKWGEDKTLKASYKRDMKNSKEYDKVEGGYNNIIWNQLSENMYSVVVQSLEQKYSVHMRMRAFWEKTKHTKGYIWIITNTDKEAEEIQNECYLNDSEIFLLHKLEDIKMPKRVSPVKNNEIRLRIIKPFKNNYWHGQRQADYSICDTKKEFIYIDQAGSLFKVNDKSELNLEEISKLLGYADGLISGLPEVYCITKSRSKIAENKNGVSLESYLKRKFSDKKIKKLAKSFPIVASGKSDNVSRMLENYSDTLPRELKMLVETKITVDQDIVDKYRKLESLLHKWDREKFEEFNDMRKSLIEKKKEADPNCPLLVFIASSYWYRKSDDLDRILGQYIKIKGYK